MPNSSTSTLGPLLGLLRASFGADAAIAFHWLDDRRAAADAGWPDAPDGAAVPPFALRRDVVRAAGGVLLDAEAPRRLLSSALLHALPATPHAAAVVAGTDGQGQADTDRLTCGVLLVWHAAPPDAAATAALAQRAPALRAAIGAALGQRAVAAAYDRLAGRFEAVMATVPQAVVFVDDAGAGLVNAAAGRLLDLPPGALDAARLAERMTALRAQAANAAELEHTARRLVADPDAPLDYWLWRFGAAPGRPGGRTLRVTTVPVHDGPARGRLWTFDDVTRETAAEAELEGQRAFLAGVLDSLSENVSVCTPDGRLALLNRATLETHGLTTDGARPPERWSEHDRVFLPDGETPFPTAALPHVRVLATGEDALGVEFVVRVPGRAPRTLVANAHALRAADGTLLGSVCAARDMTAQKAAERAVAEREARLALIYDSASDLMFLARVERDARGAVVGYRCESVNAPYLAVTGRAREQVVGRTLEAILPPELAAVVRERYDAVVRGGDVVRVDEEWHETHGGPAVLETTLTPVLDDSGRCTHVLAAARDITGRRRAERALRESEAAARRSEARFRGALDAMLDAFVVLHPMRDAAGRIEDFTIVEANAAAAALTQAALDDLVGLSVGELIPVTRGSGLFDVWRRVLATGERYDGEYETQDPRYGGAWVRMQVVPVGEGLAVTARDVTEQKRTEATLRELAVRDELTGLLNRRGFRQLVDQELRVARRERRRDAVLALDLNGFKPINDTYGHAAGDEALRSVAHLLRATLRETDVIARLGGDEFVVYAPMLQGAQEAAAVAGRVQRALGLANVAAAAAGRPFAIEAEIGVAEVEEGDDLESLLARADASLYAAKRSGPPVGRRQARLASST